MLSENQLQTLERIKNINNKEIVLLGLYSYQIVATVDFVNNRIMYRVGNHESTKLTTDLNKAIDMIKEMVENDPKCK